MFQQDNYKILGIEPTATDEEVEAAYARLKAKYNEEKWQEGEAGNEAARMLGRVETAYREILSERRDAHARTDSADAYSEITTAIKSGDIAKAQELLDAFNERNAEWHYLQSVVFFKKNWMNESKKQLEIAMQMDESNMKYKDAYSKLTARTDYKSETGGAQSGTNEQGMGGEQMGGSWCSSCASMCYTYLCINCLCNLCCNCR